MKLKDSNETFTDIVLSVTLCLCEISLVAIAIAVIILFLNNDKKCKCQCENKYNETVAEVVKEIKDEISN